MHYRSPYPDVWIPEVSLANFLLGKIYTDKPALIDGATGRIVSYPQLAENVRSAARRLAVLGVRQGDVVALYGPSSPEYATTFYAVVSLGATITTLSRLHNVAELSYKLHDSGASALIAPSRASDTVRRAAQRTSVPRIIALEDVIGGSTQLLPNNDLERPKPAIDIRQSVAALIYSDGATDVPMGAMLTHYNLVANVVQTHAVDPIDRDEVLIEMMPFCQMYGMVATNLALHAGATMVTLPQFALPSVLEVMQRFRVTRAYLDPVIIRTMTKHAPATGYDLSSLRDIISLTSSLSESLGHACAERFGCTVRQAYGLTEAVAFTHFTPRNQPGITSVGIAVPSTEFRIVDVAMTTDVAPGKLGEIWVRGPQVMKGYHNYPEISAHIVDEDGWLHTCDLGYADEDGHLSVIDRSKRLARLRGLHCEDRELLRASVEDIAARRERDGRLAFQATLLDSVRESVISTDLKNRVTFWNKGSEHLFGYSADEAIGKPIVSLIFPPGEQLKLPDKSLALRTRGTWNSQVMRRRQDGSQLWADLVVSVVRNGDGRLSGFIGLHRDITEQKQIEDRLRFQAQLLDSVHESVVATDLTGRTIFWGKGAEGLFGYSSAEMLGQPLIALTFPPADNPLEEFEKARDEVLRNGIWRGTSGLCCRGSDLWVEILLAPIRNQEGQAVGLIAVHRDVTDLRRNQELLRDSHERMRNLTARLLVVREQERSAIARELHDELGQALTRLSIDLSSLTKRLPARLRTKRVHSMGSLVDGMLQTVQHISSELRPSMIDNLGLEAAIESHVREFAEWSGCRCDLDLRIGMLARDRDRDIAIFRILEEALTNVARHATATQVAIRAWTSRGEIFLEVEDNGIGVPDSKVASPLSLGIIGMRERAEALGGKLQIFSVNGNGTKVALQLQITESSMAGSFPT